MIESIGIRDFRGIRQGKVEGLCPINVLIGPNNSGKTALLEAMYLGSAVGRKVTVRAGHSQPRFGHLATTDMLGDWPMPRVWKKHLHLPRQPGTQTVRYALDNRTLEHVRFKLAVQSAARVLEIGNEPSNEDWPLEQAQQTALWVNDEDSNAVGIRFQQELAATYSISPPTDQTCRLVYFWDKPLTYRSRGDAAWYMTGKMPTAAHTFFYDAQKTLEHLPTDFYNRMLNLVPGWPQKLAERLSRVLDISTPFQIVFTPTGPSNEWLQGRIAPPDSPALSIDDFGDGARAAFKVLAPLIALSEVVTDEEPGVFFWEEPELFQNPRTLSRLLAEVADLALTRSLQVFIATHSIEAVSKMVELVQSGKVPEDKLRTLRTLLQAGQLTATPFSTGDLERLAQMGSDPRVPGGDAETALRFSIGTASADAGSEDE